MADVRLLVPFIKKWEGGFVCDPDDLGGATNMGVTIGTYEAYCRKKGYPRPTVERLKRLTSEEWLDILKTMYWDKWRADEIRDQNLANILVDWLWLSGKVAITTPQKILGVGADGVVGPITLSALNGYADPELLWGKIVAARREYIETIVRKRPKNQKFRKGWLNRLNTFRYV